MGARSVARERALQALYQLEVQETSVSDALDAAFTAAGAEPGAPSGKPDPESRRFAQQLVEGTHAHRAEIDALIEAHSHNWRLDRMGQIDRNVLRLAIFELKWLPDVPRKVTINEAVELGKRFGTEASSAFINGLLDRIAAELKKA
jgi:transcription antitermination protein NusB